MAKNYSTCVREAGLKIGDRVTIKRKTTDNANGWSAIWNPLMDKLIGHTGKVLSNPISSSGIKIEGAGDYNFPVFVLEKRSEWEVTVKDIRRVYKLDICSDWKERIMSEYGEYVMEAEDENEVVDIDEDFVIEGLGAAPTDSVKKFLFKLFPGLSAKMDLEPVLEGEGDTENAVSEMEEIVSNYIQKDHYIPGDTYTEKARSIFKLIKETWYK